MLFVSSASQEGTETGGFDPPPSIVTPIYSYAIQHLPVNVYFLPPSITVEIRGGSGSSSAPIIQRVTTQIKNVKNGKIIWNEKLSL